MDESRGARMTDNRRKQIEIRGEINLITIYKSLTPTAAECWKMQHLKNLRYYYLIIKKMGNIFDNKVPIYPAGSGESP